MFDYGFFRIKNDANANIAQNINIVWGGFYLFFKKYALVCRIYIYILHKRDKY